MHNLITTDVAVSAWLVGALLILVLAYIQRRTKPAEIAPNAADHPVEHTNAVRPDSYTTAVLRPPIAPENQAALLALLRPMHSPQALGLPRGDADSCWTVDFRARLTAGPADEGGGLLCAVARDADGAHVAHACIFFGDAADGGDGGERARVGLLAHVWTAEAHRRRGLSGRLLDALLRAYDEDVGGALLLGSGSPHAVSAYGKRGFEPLLGGLDGAHKGYNADDAGELIMARGLGDDHYGVDDSRGAASQGTFAVEPLVRGQWAELVLLFTSFEGAGKLPAIGIDSGLESEQRICLLLNRLRPPAAEPDAGAAWVARHRRSGRLHALGVRLGADREMHIYAVPGSRGARGALEHERAHAGDAHAGRGMCTNAAPIVDMRRTRVRRTRTRSED